MVKSVFLEPRCKQQLDEFSKSDKFAYGLIFGQPSKAGNAYVISLALTRNGSPSGSGNEENSGASQQIAATASSAAQQDADTGGDIFVTDIIVHALNALRMLPGCFFVLGMFVVNAEESNAVRTKHMRTVQSIKRALHENNWRHGLKDQDDDTANLLLTWKDGAIRCEQVSPRNGAKLTDVECTKLEQPLNWIQLRSQLNEPFDFRMSRTLEGTISVEANVMDTIEVLQRRLAQGMVFVRNDPLIEQSTTADKIFKIETVDGKDVYPDVWTRLYFTVEEPIDETKIRIDRWSGFVKCMGEISSHIFVHPKLTIGEVNHFVRTDILRSVSGRLRFYLDAFQDMTSERKARLVCTAVPPRRVYFEAFADSTILLSDFLFNGERKDQVALNAQQNFGLTIGKKAMRIRAEIMRLPKRSENEKLLPTHGARLFFKLSSWVCRAFLIFTAVAAAFAICIQVWFNYEADLEDARQI